MKRLKRFLAAFVAVVMILGNFPVYAANIDGTAKSEYLKVEKKAFLGLKNNLKKSEFVKLYSFIDGITNTCNSEIDIEIKIPNVKTRKYVIKSNETYQERYADGTVEGYVEGKKVATFNIVANDNYISLQVPELYEKYLTIDMNDLEGLANKFNINFDTDSLRREMYYNSEVNKVLTLTKEEEKIVNNALKKYAKLLDEELLKSNYFEKGNKQTITVNNANYKCDVVTYKISNKQFLDGFENVWKEVKKDTEFVDLVLNKLECLYELTSNQSSEYEEFPTKEQILGGIDTIIKKMNKEDFEEVVLKSTLYHQSGQLIRRDFGYETEDNENAISVYTLNNSKGAYYALCTDSYKIEDIISKNSKETVHNLVQTSKGLKWDYDYASDAFTCDVVESVEGFIIKVNKISNNEYEIELLDSDLNVKAVMKYVRNKITSKEYDISMDFNIMPDDQNIEVNLRLAYKKDIKLKKISTKNNEINLNKESKEELTRLFEDNKTEIEEKIKGDFGLAFYYDEIEKAQKSRLERMQSRVDNITGAMIGKAVKVWLVDTLEDPQFLAEREINISSYCWTKYSELVDIDQYISPDRTSSNNYDYYVAITAPVGNADAKIIVGISETGADLPTPCFVTEASSETEGARVIWVEP